MKVFLVLCLLQALSHGSELTQREGGRIVGGEAIPITEAPYQVSLQSNGYHFCGGTVVTNRLTVRVGSKDVYSGGEVIEVASTTKHPKFNQNTLDYDFALMKLSRSIGLDGVTKKPIKLPSATTVIKDDTLVLVSGWGLTKNDSISNEELRGVIVTIHNQVKCNTAYRNDGGVTARMVCAGSPGKDSCNGDSGGPMKRIADDVLIGLVSFGMDCADPRYPGVYSRISTARAWITSITSV